MGVPLAGFAGTKLDFKSPPLTTTLPRFWEKVAQGVGWGYFQDFKKLQNGYKKAPGNKILLSKFLKLELHFSTYK